ncbi:MAG: TaqI-like C-terminal specificity domain-containing protein, partial [Lentimicrobiaceae bacterium]|nr:TaqI-like C-terminal specificity domain-containing protein [Lentimicrobiaceae bacterium]
FNKKMFTKRGLNQKKEIPTSSMIIQLIRKKAQADYKTEIVKYTGDENDVETIIDNIRKEKQINAYTLNQSNFIKYSNNWSIPIAGQKYLEEYSEYINNSEDFSIYYDHKLSRIKFHSVFYVDGGGNFEDEYVSETWECNDDFTVFQNRINDYSKYHLKLNSKRYVNSAYITFPQGSQKIDTYMQKHKIIWRTDNPQIYQYTDEKIIIDNNQSLLISSDDENEILYLLALLNSKIVKNHFSKLFQIENEVKYYVSIKRMKQYFRVPKINSKNNQQKVKLINNMRTILEYERKTIKNCIDGRNIILQNCLNVFVENNELVISSSNHNYKYEIMQHIDKVKSVIENYFSNFENPNVNIKSIMDLNLDFKKEIEDLSCENNKIVSCLYYGNIEEKNK